MTSTVAPRNVVLTARGAGDLKQVGYTGVNTPFLTITLAGHTVETQPDAANGENPVFDETFMLELPPASPDEEAPTLHIEARNAARVLPDRTIGSGSAPLGRLFAEGSEEARVPLRDAADNPAGVAYIHLRIEQPAGRGEVASAAGTVLGEVHVAPEGHAAAGKAGPDVVPTVAAGPATPTVGATAPGGIDDPGKATYGILQD